MQRCRHPGLEERAAYGWCRQLGTPLCQAAEYRSRRPVFSIWALEEPLAEDLLAPRELFTLTNANGRVLKTAGQIALVQPARFYGSTASELAPVEAWLYFFHYDADAPSARHLPQDLQVR